jgi:hypothetical protein
MGKGKSLQEFQTGPYARHLHLAMAETRMSESPGSRKGRENSEKQTRVPVAGTSIATVAKEEYRRSVLQCFSSTLDNFLLFYAQQLMQ